MVLKAALIDIFVWTPGQMAACIVKGAACRDKPTETCEITVQLSVLQSF